MKIKPTGLVEQLSGSLGNLTIQASRGGLIARTKPSAIGTVTPIRTTRRSRLARAVTAWQSLSVAARAAWLDAAPPTDAWTARGLMSPQSGYEFFIGQFCLEDQHMSYAALTPPPAAITRDLTSISITASAAPRIFEIAFLPTPLTTDELISISLTFFSSPTSNSSGHKNWAVFDVGPNISSPVDVVDLFGPYADMLQPGLAVGVQTSLYTISARRLSRPTLTRCVIAP